MRIVKPAEHRVMPWRNGGGTTREILVEPAGDARFLHRVSIADVASDGPFSRFEGYDRHILVLEGEGMTIDMGPHGVLDLRTPRVPRSFSGDWEVTGALVRGPVKDFNLIACRARATSSLEVVTLSAPLTLAAAAGDACIVHVCEGALEGAETGDTLVLADESFDAVPRGAAVLVVARVSRLREGGARQRVASV